MKKNDSVIHLSVSNDLKCKAQEYAKSMNISLNSLLRMALSEFLRNKR